MFACVAGQEVAQHVVAEVEAERGVRVGRAVGEHLKSNQIIFIAPNIFPFLHTDSEKSLSALYCSSSFCRWVRLEKAWKLMVLSLLCDRISVTRLGRSRNEPVSISCNKYHRIWNLLLMIE